MTKTLLWEDKSCLLAFLVDTQDQIIRKNSGGNIELLKSKENQNIYCFLYCLITIYICSSILSLTSIDS